MYRGTMPAIFAIAILASPAGAADLAAHSRLGASFAEPGPAAAVVPAPLPEYYSVYAPPVDIRPLVAGYYGKPNSYLYSPYYGDSQYWNFARRPYACGFHGYC
jgi:hypothetical protein